MELFKKSKPKKGNDLLDRPSSKPKDSLLDKASKTKTKLLGNHVRKAEKRA